jgi:hypothetical protein
VIEAKVKGTRTRIFWLIVCLLFANPNQKTFSIVINKL